jgi:bacterioferritin-associated ferredoxin
MYVCICYAVTEDDLHAEIAEGARTEDDVADACGAGSACGSCQERICALLGRAPESCAQRDRMVPLAV